MPEPVEPPTRTMGPIGDRVLFENQLIRVWGIALEPGGIQPWHRHDLPYLIVPLTEGRNVMEFADGRIRETAEIVGGVLWREAGIPHELRNMASWQYCNVLIEFKQPISPGTSSGSEGSTP